ncbi:hypothetical protein JAAARDRAFT_118334 [Jaapia argillacea MUCL 33604]|uniref:14-3-3 domain-containing protein n=1 Tax=Jaapia argillacea MUCL 33604 TaxID=933084 RepID=A0A067QLU6_9AGAM|nr:hypothetical protein JAAARDRAFT_118334 [Jaapia argillacea MUCL 33604]
MTPREKRTFVAKLAEQSGRYEDVITEIVKSVRSSKGRLTGEERGLLFIAYKMITGALRTSLRMIESTERGVASDSHEATLLRKEKERITHEFAEICADLIQLLDRYLIPSASVGEEKVLYCKTKADYYRYLAEYCGHGDGDARVPYSIQALEAYKTAYRHALSSLDPIHPTRLGLALNFSVYYHDIYKCPERACHLAKRAFDEAVTVLGSAGADSPKDSLMILQLLRNDLLLWASEKINHLGGI